MADDFMLMADIEVDAVVPSPRQFILQGRGADDADYRLELRLEMPVDVRTRAVLGELLTQSGVRLYRRLRTPLRTHRQARTKTV